MNMHIDLSKFSILILIPVLIYSIYIAYHWGMADVYSSTSINKIDKKLKGKISIEAEQWKEIKRNLLVAIEYDSLNPKLHEYFGYAIEGPYTKHSIGDEVAAGVRKTAYHHYHQAISLRPTWPYPWTRLAVVKYRMGELDDEFFNTLYQANKLGPWETSIQRSIVSIGLFYWGLLNNQNREFILNVLSKSLKHIERSHSLNMLKLAKYYGVINRVCEVNDVLDYVVQYCKEHSG